MKITKLAGIAILIPVLLAGCGAKNDTQSAAAANTSPPAQQSGQAAGGTGQGGGNVQNRPQMSAAQRTMFTTFQTLEMMDRQDGLAITKEQAQAMLPVVQDVVDKKELSDDNKTKLLEKLTDEQKKFITDAESRMASRGQGGGPGGQGAGGEGRPNRGGQGSAAPNASAAPQAGGDAAGSANGAADGKSGAGADANAAGGNGGGRNFGGGGGAGGQGGNRSNGGGQFANPGQQLIELLQSKTK
ncbi:hypothetical protein [Paenibacillus whitsoniae]|uniref:DUF2680 domain-containing protein n=1 Tax=Paenibacillus whitsoniae TaxID=2496558 RepID=A0A3S0C4S3_9BACL|nr:hypothetical protein [Paenibacillus whitsoniae]RTE02445.1 hypothetical protein EJQ19_29455 [Paenibacillus whitsoniae]